jgi:hypothetical protein
MPDFGGLVTTDPVINAETRSPVVIAIAVSFSAVSLLVVILRLYTRICLLNFAGSDDVTIVIAEVINPWSRPVGRKHLAYTCTMKVLAIATAVGASMGMSRDISRSVNETACTDKNLEAKHGLGRHTWTVSKEDAQIQLKVWLTGMPRSLTQMGFLFCSTHVQLTFIT